MQEEARRLELCVRQRPFLRLRVGSDVFGTTCCRRRGSRYPCSSEHRTGQGGSAQELFSSGGNGSNSREHSNFETALQHYNSNNNDNNNVNNNR